MRIAFVAVLAFFVAIVLLGCGRAEDKIVGKWAGSTLIYRPPSGNASLDEKLANIKTEAKYALSLGPDKTYRLNVGNDTIVGTWTINAGAITLTPTKVNDKDTSKQRAEFDQMNSRLNIRLPVPEGMDGPKIGTVSDDFSKITLPSIGTTVELKRDSAAP
jgi:hypothetical protein